MSPTPDRLVLWTGEKHSGKTTALADLVRIVSSEGFNVVGILAPSLYRDGRLTGFDVVNLRDETRVPLARRKIDTNMFWHFDFVDEGLRFGNTALSKKATKYADLIVVDEFGPLELSGYGWRDRVDSLLTANSAVVLLVVRRELVDSVRRLYIDFHCYKVDFAEPEAPGKIIAILSNRRQLPSKT